MNKILFLSFAVAAIITTTIGSIYIVESLKQSELSVTQDYCFGAVVDAIIEYNTDCFVYNRCPEKRQLTYIGFQDTQIKSSCLSQNQFESSDFCVKSPTQTRYFTTLC